MLALGKCMAIVEDVCDVENKPGCKRPGLFLYQVVQF